MDRFLASVFAGVLALMVALNAGLPFWHHLPIGDAADIGAATFFATWYAIKALRPVSVTIRDEGIDG